MKKKGLLLILIISSLIIIGTVITYFSLSSLKDKRIVLRGDLHCHTSYSHDGEFTVEQTADFAKKAGYDFISLTDHYSIRQNEDPYRDDKLIIIPGMELTLRVGHANIIGIPNPIEANNMVTQKEVEQYFKDMQVAGAKVQIDHPFHNKYLWKLDMDMNYDWVEIWNSKWADYNQMALDWWQEELAKGKRIVGTGGSDAHTIKENRTPFNCVFSDSKQPADILSAIAKGNIYVSASAKGPDIELRSGKYIMGDVVPFKSGNKVNLKLSNLNTGNFIRILTDKGCEQEIEASGTSFNKDWAMEDRLFYRIEVWDSNSKTTLLAFSNPLYIDNKN